MCVIRTITHISTEYVDTCPNSPSSDNKTLTLLRSDPYAKLVHTGTDQHRVHRPMATIPGQCFSIGAFTCKHVSIRGYKYCDLMRDNASQMIYCDFIKNRTAGEIYCFLTDT